MGQLAATWIGRPLIVALWRPGRWLLRASGPWLRLLCAVCLAALALGLARLQNIRLGLANFADPSPSHLILAPLWHAGRPTVVAWLLLVYVILIASGYWLLRVRRPSADRCLYFLHVALLTLGILLMGRLDDGNGLLRRQLTWACLGLPITVSVALMLKEGHLELLRHRKYVLAIVGMLVLTATGFFGREVNQHRLWLQVGPLRFQPIELVKILFVPAIAGCLTDWRDPCHRLGAAHRFTRILPTLLVFFGLAAPAVLQRDFGPIFLLSLVYFFMLTIGAGRVLLPLAQITLLCMVGWLAYTWGWPSIVRIRVDMWLDPFGHSEQLTQSCWAIAQGGWWGSGFGMSQSSEIPIVFSDMIMVLVAEEWGFLGTVSILCLMAALLLRALGMAGSLQNDFAKLMVVGYVALLLAQILTLSLGNLTLIPLTGITMPWLSYGGSSLIMVCLIQGFLIGLDPSSKLDKQLPRHGPMVRRGI